VSRGDLQWQALAQEFVAVKLGRKTLVGVGVAALLVGAVVCVVWLMHPVTVHVVNKTGEPMNDVAVSTLDESVLRAAVPPLGEWSLTLHPKRETGIDLRWRDQKGNSCGGYVDEYLERGFRGTVSVQILGCHDVKFKSDVNVSLFGMGSGRSDENSSSYGG
jgi:hypothetical protein